MYKEGRVRNPSLITKLQVRDQKNKKGVTSYNYKFNSSWRQKICHKGVQMFCSPLLMNPLLHQLSQESNKKSIPTQKAIKDFWSHLSNFHEPLSFLFTQDITSAKSSSTKMFERPSASQLASNLPVQLKKVLPQQLALLQHVSIVLILIFEDDS